MPLPLLQLSASDVNQNTSLMLHLSHRCPDAAYIKREAQISKETRKISSYRLYLKRFSLSFELLDDGG